MTEHPQLDILHHRSSASIVAVNVAIIIWVTITVDIVNGTTAIACICAVVAVIVLLWFYGLFLVQKTLLCFGF